MAGVPGEEHPRHPAGSLGSLRSRQGAVSSPLRGCGPHQPLDPPCARKAATGPRRGLGWRCWSGWGSRLAQRPRSGPGLDAQERPHAWAGGWGCFSPAACHVANAPGGPSETILLLSLWVSATPERQRAGREAKRRGSNSPEGSYTLLLAASRAATGFRRKLICGALPSARGVAGAPQRRPWGLTR